MYEAGPTTEKLQRYRTAAAVRVLRTIESPCRPRLHAADHICAIQYNTTDLRSPFFLLHAKLKSALSRIIGVEAVVMQGIVSEELAQGPDPYT